jgi:hypothetical protein
MAEEPSTPDTAGGGIPTDPPTEPRMRPPADTSAVGTPRWVKVFAIVGVVLVLLVVAMLLNGHGPGRHAAGLGGRPRTDGLALNTAAHGQRP